MSFFVGLDLGQAADYTALTVVEKNGEEYHLRHLERFQLGTPYTVIVERVKTLLKAAELGQLPTLVVDATGVGKPVVDMLAGTPNMISVTITGGENVTRERQEYRVPKRDLASTLQVLLQNGRLKFADGLPLLDVLLSELQNFKVKINTRTGHDSYEHWRESDHDDLVLSLALACWYGENERTPRVVPLFS